MANPLQAYFEAQKSPCCVSRSKAHKGQDHTQFWVRQQYPRVFCTRSELERLFTILELKIHHFLYRDWEAQKDAEAALELGYDRVQWESDIEGARRMRGSARQ